MQKTVTIQIGNSDNKLSQIKWAEFVNKLELIVSKYCYLTHFSGGSDGRLPWQNWCIVAQINQRQIKNFGAKLVLLTVEFDQDSIAVTFGNTLFL